MASVPITVLLYNGPLLCGFNVPVKGLTAIAGIEVNHPYHSDPSKTGTCWKTVQL